MCEPVPIGASVGVGAFPSREGIADGVFANAEPGGFAKTLHIGPRAQVGFAEDNARHHGRFSFRDLPQSHQLSDQAINRELRASPLSFAFSQRMAAPVFVEEVFCRALAERAKPLRTVGAHPDEVAGIDGIP